MFSKIWKRRLLRWPAFNHAMIPASSIGWRLVIATSAVYGWCRVARIQPAHSAKEEESQAFRGVQLSPSAEVFDQPAVWHVDGLAVAIQKQRHCHSDFVVGVIAEAEFAIKFFSWMPGDFLQSRRSPMAVFLVPSELQQTKKVMRALSFIWFCTTPRDNIQPGGWR